MKQRHLHPLLGAVLVVALIFSFTSSFNVARATPAGIDVALVLDDSGSTIGAENSTPTDPTGRRCLAGQVLVNLLDESDSFSLVRFSTNAQTAVPLGQLTPTQRSHSLGALDSCPGKGDTNYVDALNHVSAEFAKSDPARPKYVIFATDGEPTVGGGRDAILKLARDFGARGWHIFPVAFDVSLDPSLLTDVANASGGRYMQAKTATDIPGIVQQIFGGFKEFVPLPSQQVCLNQPQTIHIGEADNALFTILYPPRATIQVKSPPGVGGQRTSGYTSKGGQPSNEVVAVTNPKGDWIFSLSGAAGSQCATLGGEVHYPSQLSVEAPSSVGFSGQPIDLRINFTTLNDKGQFAFDPGVRVHATLQQEGDPNPKDVQNVDLAPQNDRFTGSFSPVAQPGVAAIDLSASKGGTPIYASPAPIQVELVAPPTVNVDAPNGALKLGFGEGAAVKLDVGDTSNVVVDRAALELLDASGATIGEVPLTKGAGSSWTGTLPLWQSGSYKVRVRLTARVHGPRLGKDGEAGLLTPEQPIQATVATPSLAWQMPASVNLATDGTIALKACYAAGATPKIVPSARAVLVAPDQQSQTVPLGALDNNGCYNGETRLPVPNGPATYALRLNLLDDRQGIIWSGLDRKVQVGPASLQLKLSFPTGNVPPNAILTARVQTSDGTPVALDRIEGSLTIQPPTGSAQSVTLVRPAVDGQTILTAPLQIARSGSYTLRASVQGFLNGMPVTVTSPDQSVHWLVPPAIEVAPVLGGQTPYWDLGNLSGSAPARAVTILVSSNLDEPVTLSATPSSHDLQIAVDPAVIPPGADKVTVTLRPRLSGSGTPIVGGSETVDVQFAARAGARTIPVQPTQSLRGIMRYSRSGLLERVSGEVVPIVAGIALLLGGIYAFLKLRRRSLPNAAVGQFVAIKGKGATVILSQNRRGWWRSLTSPQRLVLCGPKADTPMLAPGAARVWAAREGEKTRWFLERVSDPPISISRDDEIFEPAIGERFLLQHDDLLDFGRSALYCYVNLEARGDDFWRKQSQPRVNDVSVPR